MAVTTGKFATWLNSKVNVTSETTHSIRIGPSIDELSTSVTDVAETLDKKPGQLGDSYHRVTSPHRCRWPVVLSHPTYQTIPSVPARRCDSSRSKKKLSSHLKSFR